MSKNAEGWVRHRGGKCPVDKYAHIEYRLRSGQKLSTATGGMLNWGHGKWASDIMAYRLHSQADQQKPFIEAVQAFNALAKFPRLDGPLKWRDRIAEIDSTTQALTTERAELVQKLAGEGFALIGQVVEPVDDMSDWKNWKDGDILLITSNKSGHQFQLGEQVRISGKSKPSASGCGFSIEHLDGSDYWYVDSSDLEFSSRPSA